MRILSIVSLGFIGFYFLSICVFFIITPAQFSWDLMGHYMASKEMADNFWPYPMGWSSIQLGGYPHGYFYPPLSHWLLATMTQFLSLDISAKALLFLSFSLIPYLFYRLANRLSDELSDRLVILNFALINYFLVKGPVGGDAYGIFFGGLYANHFGFVFFILFLENFFSLILNKDIHNVNTNKSVFLSALFLSLLVWTHPFLALTSILLILGLGILGDLSFRSMLGVLIVGALGSVGWWGPYVILSKYQSGQFVGAGVLFNGYSKVLFYLLLTGVSLACLKMFYSTKNTKSLVVAKSLGVIVVFFIFFSLLETLGFHYKIQLPFHSYRVLGPIYFLLSICVALFLIQMNRMKKHYLVLLSTAVLGVVFTFFVLKVYSFDIDSIVNRVFKMQSLSNDGLNLGGQLVVSLDVVDFPNSPHIDYFTINELGGKTFNGLFVESSLKSAFIFSLQNLITRAAHSNSFLWGVSPAQLESNNIVKNLKWLGVDSVFLSGLNSSKVKYVHSLLGAAQEIYKLSNDFYMYRPERKSGAILLSIPPRFVCNDYDRELFYWWADEDLHQSLIVNSCDKLTDSISLGFDRNLDVTDINSESFVLEGNSKAESSIYVPRSYFPHWKATNLKNENIPIRIAGPYNMYLRSSLPVKFKFERPFYEKVFLFVSVCTLFFCLFTSGAFIQVFRSSSSD